MMREQLFKIAEQSGMTCIDSCCSVPNKSCSLDVWKGDLIAFANAVIAAHRQPNWEPVAWLVEREKRDGSSCFEVTNDSEMDAFPVYEIQPIIQHKGGN